VSAAPDAIGYRVERSTRSTMDIVVERDGSVVVHAPHRADDARVAAIVKARDAWIRRGLAAWREANASHVQREFRNGEGFPYLGRSYRLLLVDDQKEPVVLRNGRFLVRRDLVRGKNAERARAAFRDYYAERGRERLRERVAYFGERVGARAAAVEVADLGYRWASCSSGGRLSFHWKCVMAPLRVVDYLVVHELCHLHQRTHSAAFWNEIDKVLPDHRERRAWLRRQGASLDV